MPKASPPGLTNLLSRLAQYLTVAAHSRAFSTVICVLSVAFTALLAAVTFFPSAPQDAYFPPNAQSIVLTALGGALSVALAIWVMGSRIAFDKLQTQARA